MTIQEYLTGKGYHVPSDEYYAAVQEWIQWYAGELTEFHQYRIHNGQATVNQNRRRLYMAKQICEDWANLLMTENVSIVVEGAYQTRLSEVLQRNRFQPRANQLVELAFATGSGAFVEYRGRDGEAMIDYVRGGMIFPLGWENGTVLECAFASTRKVDGKEAYYVQIHRLENGEYIINNAYVDAQSGTELPLPEWMEPEVRTGTDIPLFQIIKPNIVNSVDLDNPLGMAVYADAMDILKSCDLIYDCYCTEFLLGRKRLMIPAGLLQNANVMGENYYPMFDPNDLAFQTIPEEAADKLMEVGGDLRAEEHEIALKRNLSQLSAKCGLGYDRYQFNGVAPKTATEVITTRSDTYLAKCKHQQVLREALTGMVQALAYLDGTEAGKVTVEFDDSIVTDRKADFAEYQQLLAMGLMRPEEVRAWYFNEDLETAKKNLPQSSDLLE